MECCICVIIFAFILYKVVDWLLRIPTVGRYDDRYILVTGCDTGFGNLFAKRLDERGCHVFAGCLTEKGETELRKSCSDRLHAIHMDVSKPESVQKTLEYVRSKLPSGRGLWGVLNNAGIVHKLGHPEWMNLDDYRIVNDVNLLGMISVTMTFLPLVKVERGRVVCTSSIFGRLALVNAAPYCVSKYGIQAFVDGLRRSLIAFRCKAILVEPGVHLTPMSVPDHLVTSYKKAWDGTTSEVRAEYGQDFYEYVTGRGIEKFIDKACKNLNGVIDAYEHAILGLYPRVRYTVGIDTKFFWIPVQALPEWIGDWILSKVDPETPLPQAVRNL